MLKHDLRTSEKVASWPIDLRYFWVLLWGYLDDHGKGKDNPLLIKSDCFPLDVQITGETIDGWLWVLADNWVVARYSAAGQDFLQAVNWKEHQKPPHPTPDVLPPFDAPQSVRRELHASRMKDAEQPHAPLTPVLGSDWVKSGIGFVNGSSPAVMVQLFESAWSHWPKKTEKDPAREKFKSVARMLGAQEIHDHIVRFGDAYAATTDRQYVPGLGTWLNKKRWSDDLPTGPTNSGTTRGQENLAMVAKYAALENNQLGIDQ